MTSDVPAVDPSAPASIVAELGVSRNVRLAEELVSEALGLITDQPDTLDLKIATAALAEMRDAFAVFAPFRSTRKVTIFGSARTKAGSPSYEQARLLSADLAHRGWMTVTGAGPGIMEAGMRGAGRERSIGVSIRLPFEQSANSVIAGDDKHVSMRYFFTRKLMLIKESAAFVCLPGGFGTLDEMFELLTLTQTGKGIPVPIVLLDVPGDPYWDSVDTFVRDQLVRRGLVAERDTALYDITQSVAEACRRIEEFYANYHSMRYVGDTLVIRMKRAPGPEELTVLNERFGHLVASGSIRRTNPLRVEVRDEDHLELERISFAFTKSAHADLLELIRALPT